MTNRKRKVRVLGWLFGGWWLFQVGGCELPTVESLQGFVVDLARSALAAWLL